MRQQCKAAFGRKSLPCIVSVRDSRQDGGVVGKRRQSQCSKPGRFRVLQPTGTSIARAHQPADERIGNLAVVAESRPRRLQHRPSRDDYFAFADNARQQRSAIGSR